MKTGTVKQNRNQGNFIKRMNEDKRETFIKDWIARCNAKTLLPFIKITKRDRYWRTVKYEITSGDTVQKGITHNSRNDSDRLMSLRPEKREQSIKQFIADCNPKALIPFIEITGHDENYRNIEYQIDTSLLKKD